MAKKGCEQRRVALAYPKHAYSPEDLLHFIESTEFTEAWTAHGLDDEDELTSLQLCLMMGPKRDSVIEGTGGLRKHEHSFNECASASKGLISVFYVYFEEYGIVYLSTLEYDIGNVLFTGSQRAEIREGISLIKAELDRLKTIR